MTRLLAISTSTRRGSAALVEDGRVLGFAAYEEAKGHAERVFAAIDEVLAAAGCGRGAIEALACDVGPGSFTGVRVGVAAAKGIAMALSIPVYGVRSLDAMAAAARDEGGVDAGVVVLAAIDAKKDEVFLARYGAGLDVAIEPRHVPRGEVAAYARGAPASPPVVLAGEVLAELGALDGRLLRGPSIDLPDARFVARVAMARLADARLRGEGDAADLEPLYVRAPDAKLMDPPVARPA